MIILKQNDTGIGLKATLSNQDGSIDLTDADVLFLMKDHVIVSKKIDDEKGTVEVVFNKIHTEKVGLFSAEFKVKFKDGRVESFPNNDYLQIKIIKELGGRL